jgi:serine/threonine protein kinase
MSQQSILTKNLINPNSAVEFPPKPAVSEACRDFIQQCLTTDVRQRPTADQLLAHVYLQKPTIPKSRFKEPAPKVVAE